jgi:nucleotide-binding universal stress UspA family protein
MSIPRTILVPISASAASLEAVGIACSLAKARKGSVLAVHVIEVLRSLPLDADIEAEARRGEQLLRRAEEVAAAHDFPIRGELLKAREAGPAILDEARDHDVDVIILGVGYKRLIGSFQVGRTAEHVLKNATCQVWVVRQALGRPQEAGQHPQGGTR